jgi:endoglucanase
LQRFGGWAGLLEKLCNAFGVSGAETQVRDLLQNVMSSHCNTTQIDSMGNLICYKKGNKGYKNSIMLAAHMDEVGFIISGITNEGYLRFKTVGGIDIRVITAKSVVVGPQKIPGVIGVIPPHLDEKENNATPKTGDLFIDIGAKDAEQAKKYINIGDYAGFDSKFMEFGSCLVKAKALDNRVGCYILTELANYIYAHDVYFSFTVQEEVGCRGAATAAYNVLPSVALVVETTTCSDVIGTEKEDYSTRLNQGAAISLLDRTSYSDKGIVKALVTTAKNNNIKYQYKQTTLGGNDAGTIHLTENGIRTGVISVPCRYIHSPSSVASKNDIEGCRDIIYNLLRSEESEEWSF